MDVIFGLTVYISDPGLNTCVPESLSASSTCIACSIKVLPLLTSFCDWPAESGGPPNLLEGLFLLPHPFPQSLQQPVICLEQQRSWLSLSRGGLLLPTHISGDMVTLIAFLIPMPKHISRYHIPSAGEAGPGPREDAGGCATSRMLCGRDAPRRGAAAMRPCLLFPPPGPGGAGGRALPAVEAAARHRPRRGWPRVGPGMRGRCPQ